MSLARLLMLIAGARKTMWRFRAGDVNANVTLSDGNRTLSLAVPSAVPVGGRGTPYSVIGKWYIEALAATVVGGDTSIGIGNDAQSTGNFVGAAGNSCGYLASGEIRRNSALAATYATYATGDIIGVAVDTTALRAWFSKNGVWLSGNPVTGTGGITITSDAYFPMVSVKNGGAWTIPFTPVYPAPSDFLVR